MSQINDKLQQLDVWLRLGRYWFQDDIWKFILNNKLYFDGERSLQIESEPEEREAGVGSVE